MNVTFFATLLVQSISALLIGWLLHYYARIYHRKYLFYWAYSFYGLAVFLSGSFLGLALVQLGMSPTSPWRMLNLFILTTAGYLQIAFLVFGTTALVKDTEIKKRTLWRILVACMVIALAVTLFKNWDPDGAGLRYLMRIGLRYFTAGLACLGTAIYILRNDPNPIIGKKLVTIGFFIYGFEMSFLGWLTFESQFLGGSELLGYLVPYHGLFELILYPIIGIGLIVWLLEVERSRSQKVVEQLQHLNLSDGLTGLPNQQALNQYLQQWMKVAEPKDALTLALFGVDKMSRFNVGEGFKQGDQLLIALGKRIEMLCTGQPFYGRIYGDVFVLLLSGAGQTQINKINNLRRQLSRPFKLGGKTYHLEVSSGAVSFTADQDHEVAFNQANQALQSAKYLGGKQSLTYRKNMALPDKTDISFENELRTALKNKQFVLHYQPIWLNKSQIICFEALIRWQHPTQGLLQPAAFLSLVQQLGLMVELDYWVTEEAIKQVKLWRKINPDAAKVTVNLSADTIQHGGIVEHIKQCSLKHQVTTGHITAEITENTVMHNIESGTNTLNELRQLGLNIAIDDFGTGYSSLNYLRTFPSDVIKFDRSFVGDSQNHEINQEILKALIPLCHQLDKKVVIEGVENQTQFQDLQALQVDGFQGYYLCYPVAVEEATKMLTMSKKSMLKAMLKGLQV